MKKIIIALLTGLLSIILIMISCDKCGECFTPPTGIGISITDHVDSTDFIFNGTYHADSIMIYYYDQNNKKNVEISTISDTLNQTGIVYSRDIAWKSVEGFKNFYLYLNYEDTDTIYLNVVSETKNCCTNHPVKAFTINDEQISNDSDNNCYNLKK